ncbi:hypothetical protein QQG55_22610 [Brugia pahangi]|uniref:Peptidase_M1 domain-containing protein n=1 Tax=Brugia pahangi TaxID=6280 RepID=A0A0N4TV32_BRUPA|nr:unnamed protein product [Brugia pahangi]
MKNKEEHILTNYHKSPTKQWNCQGCLKGPFTYKQRQDELFMGTYNAPMICSQTISTHYKQTPTLVLKAKKDESPDIRDASPNFKEVALYHYYQALCKGLSHPSVVDSIFNMYTNAQYTMSVNFLFPTDLETICFWPYSRILSGHSHEPLMNILNWIPPAGISLSTFLHDPLYITVSINRNSNVTAICSRKYMQ